MGIDEGVAAVRLSTKGCGGSASGVEEAVRDARAAGRRPPELLDVRRVPDEPAAAFVPLETLLPTAAPAAGGTT